MVKTESKKKARLGTDSQLHMLYFWISKNFQLSRSCDLDLYLGSGIWQTVVHHSSTSTDISKFLWDRKKFLWIDGHQDRL